MKTDNTRLIRADVLRVDPLRFQFRTGSNHHGDSGRLSGVTEWQPEYAGILLVWEDFGGDLYVVDGHHRHALAMRVFRRTGTPLWVRCRVYRWNTVDEAQARRMGALRNIAEGNADALDIARLLRNGMTAEDLKGRVPQRSPVYDGKALATLEPVAWSLVLNSDVDPSHAAEVARAFPGDAARQYGAISYLARNPAGSKTAARNFVDQLRAATFDQTENLFGDDGRFREIELRAEILTAAQSRLRNARAAFGNAVRNADRLQDAGNILADDTNADMHKRASELAADLPRLTAFPGAASDALTRAVYAVGEGGIVTNAVDGFIGDLFTLGQAA